MLPQQQRVEHLHVRHVQPELSRNAVVVDHLIDEVDLLLEHKSRDDARHSVIG